MSGTSHFGFIDQIFFHFPQEMEPSAKSLLSVLCELRISTSRKILYKSEKLL